MADSRDSGDVALTFSQPQDEKRSWLPWVIAGIAIVAVLVLVVVLGGHSSNAPASGPGLSPPDPYAAQLAVSGLKMSEASNFAGGKVTYLDGQIANQGPKTLTGITVQVAFRNDLKEIGLKETLPLSLIRTREPYVDTQPVSAAPIHSGEQRDFRLIFDNIPADWNQQFPEVRIIRVQSN